MKENEQYRKRIRNTITSPTIFEHGKLPPQAVDFEEAVLGAAMLEKDAFNTIKNILRSNYFYKESHQRIFEAISELNYNNSPIDILTVTQQLKKNGDLDLSGGAYYITLLTSRVASSANIEAHARIIQQKYLQREIIRISSEMIREAFEDTTDVFDLISLYNNYGTLLNTELGSGIEPTHISEITPQILAQIQKHVNNETLITGIPTGLKKYIGIR